MADTRTCRCGQPITVEWKWNGLAYYPAFLHIVDEDRPGYHYSSTTEVDHCPKCGEALDHQWLKTASNEANYR